MSAGGLVPGRVIGDFRLESKLGEGGMGQVWRATQLSLDRLVALKLMPSDRVFSETRLAMFEREARAGGRLHHPSIVSVLAYGEDDGIPFIAQELVGDGWSLADSLREAQAAGDLPDDWFVRIAGFFATATDALHVAHEAGVVHRDLKPGNILIGEDDRPMIADFGLARVAGMESLSRTGDLAGTYAYMSPEQAQAKRIGIDHRADIYALGATLYEALTLRRAVEGDTHEQITENIIYIDPPAPHVLRSKLDRDLSAVVMKALEKHRQDRYQTMAEFAADLRRWLANEPVLAKPAGPVRRAQKWMARHRTESAVMGIALLSAAIFAWLAGRLSESNTELTSSLTREQRVRADLQTSLGEEQAQRERAAENAADANANATRADREKANVLRLSAFQELNDLKREADDLWPPTPERLSEYDDWLVRADALVAGLLPSADGEDMGHRLQLLELRARALPRTEAQVEAGLARERKSLAALDTEIETRRAYTFAAANDTWWHSQLAKLIEQIEAFADPQTGLMEGISDEFGWGIGRRKAFAATIEQRTLTGAEASRRWAEAVASIADREQCPLYDGLSLPPQLGLLPIGRDPDSGLWEFWHVMSGDEPLRGEDEKLVLSEASGIVLVLIPGGTFWMGAQAGDPEGRNYVPQAASHESPVHEVTLSPYLLGKYEMTQGQWLAVTDRNPSQFGGPDSYRSNWDRSNRGWSALHPVEQVSWNDCVRVLGQLGLELPTEAQWERGCRAGTSTAFWSGDEPESLKGVANLSDQYGHEHGNEAWDGWVPWLDDGHTRHARVGFYRPNGFGLYDTHGNVDEWCLDGSHDGGFYARSPAVNPLNEPSGAKNRVNRGGSFAHRSSYARSAFRVPHNVPGFQARVVGLRPAKGITP